MCRPSFWSSDLSPLLSLLLPPSSLFSTCPAPSICTPPVSSCIRKLIRTAPHPSQVQVVSIASSSFCYSLFEAFVEPAVSSSSPPAANAAAAATAPAQFSFIYVDRDHFSDDFFQTKLKEIGKARDHYQLKKKELEHSETSGAPLEKKKAMEMEIKAMSDNVSAVEKKYMDMHSQRDRYRTALKERNSSAQPFFDHANALIASFKTFPLHCFGTQKAVSPSFALSPPQVSFRFTASTYDDTTSLTPSKFPQLPVVIEATDVSVLAFNDPVPLLVHSKVICANLLAFL